MTRTLAQSRTRRSQILCVGFGNTSDELSNSSMVSMVRVESLFDAIGKLTLSSARQPIDTIIIAEHALNGATPQSIDAIRDIEPAAKLVLVRAADSEHGALDSMFDQTITSPSSDAALLQALGVQPDKQSQTEAHQPAMAAAEEKNTPQRHAEPPTSAAPNEQLTESSLPPRKQTRRTEVPAQSENPTTGDERLGDVDLVESIIDQDGRLLELCMRLIMQQTGWSDVLFNDSGELMDGAVASVAHAGQAFGMLATQSADARTLKPWADWLARWLALDEAHRTYRLDSLRDELTGAWNRRFFNEFISDALKRARQLRMPVTVMVFDIDDFKIYNDRYGHDAGDEILTETVRLLESVIRQCDRVCRIGGDEFAVVFADLDGPRAAGSEHPDAVEDIAKRFQKQVTAMTFPKLSREAPGSLTISGGLATFPWDGDDPNVLLSLADHRALHSKRAGKNVITFGPEV